MENVVEFTSPITEITQVRSGRFKDEGNASLALKGLAVVKSQPARSARLLHIAQAELR